MPAIEKNWVEFWRNPPKRMSEAERAEYLEKKVKELQGPRRMPPFRPIEDLRHTWRVWKESERKKAEAEAKKAGPRAPAP